MTPGTMVKMAVLVEVGDVNTFPSDSSVASDPAWAVEWIELPRGLSLSSLGSARTLRGWSRSPRPSSVDSQDLPEVLRLFCACLAGCGVHIEGSCDPSPFLLHHPASGSLFPASGGAIRQAAPAPVCSARRGASGLAC